MMKWTPLSEARELWRGIKCAYGCVCVRACACCERWSMRLWGAAHQPYDARRMRMQCCVKEQAHPPPLAVHSRDVVRGHSSECPQEYPIPQPVLQFSIIYEVTFRQYWLALSPRPAEQPTLLDMLSLCGSHTTGTSLGTNGSRLSDVGGS